MLPRGGDILNDIGGLPTDENARICAETGAALLIMHSVGEPKVPHTHVGYEDIMARSTRSSRRRSRSPKRPALPRDAIILDPGIDFAKQRADNLRIYPRTRAPSPFRAAHPPARLAQDGDRRRARDSNAARARCRHGGVHRPGNARGAHIFRVHNVRAAVQTVRTLAALEEPSRLDLPDQRIQLLRLAGRADVSRRAVSRLKESVAERCSSSSGEVATTGISKSPSGRVKW